MSNNARRRRRTKSNAATTDPSERRKKIASTSPPLPTMDHDRPPPASWVMLNAILYVLSGVTQPILMAYAQHAGLADPRCQLYMLFYYIGPASVAFSLRCAPRRKKKKEEETNRGGKSSNGLMHATFVKGNDAIKGNDVNYNSTFNNDSNGAPSYGSTSNSDTAHSIGCDDGNDSENNNIDTEYEDEDPERSWPSRSLAVKAAGIATFDLFAQSMVYTGNNFAGPTIFSIIYSSVTIWAALYSKLLLSRSMSKPQWAGVCLVVLGLSLTAMDSSKVGDRIFLGACLILVGSSFHGLTYVMSERIMAAPSPPQTTAVACIGSEDAKATASKKNYAPLREEPRRHISIRANCAIQGIVATLVLLFWQLVYTLPRLSSLILHPMAEAGTTPLRAMSILGSISLANLLHSVTFFATLKHFPGGATSAGVLKGLQAVLVFAASAMVLCGRWGGVEMCWSRIKGLSLVVVVCGILTYGAFTEKDRRMKNDPRVLSMRQRGECYQRVEEGDVSRDEGRIMCV